MSILPRWRIVATAVLIWALAVAAGTGAAPAQGRRTGDTNSRAGQIKPLPETVDDLKAIQKQVNLVLKDVMAAVVNVKVGASQGSGVIVSDDGTILTAGHVSGKAGKAAEVTLADGKVVKGLTLGGNRGVDNGMMKITTPGPYPYLPMGKSAAVKPGDWVIAVGHPGGYQKGRTPPVRLGRVTRAFEDMIETDCPLVGGDSGGPLFNLKGEVIAIHSRIATELTANIHVPIDTYKRNWEGLVNQEVWFGGRLGFQYGNNDPNIRGCTVASVVAGTPADKAGLQAKDVIVRLDGKPIKGYDDLLNAMSIFRDGDEVTLDVRRGEETLQLRSKVLSRKEE
jgi:serine protease Do